jgi:ribose transport system ATP-binding protein
MLELRGIGKRFPGVMALEDISLSFEPGRIHAIVGENGAGKSTLIKVITGIVPPDAGEVFFEGKRLEFRDYRDSLACGIDVVNQEIQVVPESTVAENIMLDKLVTRGRTGIVDWKALRRVARTYLDMVGLTVPADMVVRDLGAAQKQLVQIAKALAADARVLFLDEPTSSLTEHEAANLFRILRGLRDKGATIIFVSHKFEEVFALSDTVSVLRDGRLVGTRPIAGLTPQELVRMMIGRDVEDARLGRLDIEREREMLRADHLVRRGRIEDVSFTLCRGEILGFYGLVGAGRTELARCLIGEDRIDGGTVFIRGERAVPRSVADSLERHRIGYVTENRKEEGLLLGSPVRTNVTITVWPRLVRRLTRVISRTKELAVTADMIRALDIRTTGPEQRTEDLSGGNQQKVSISKWLAAECDILIIDEPTVGVDVGAKDQIHRLIWNLAKTEGKAIVLISSDMPEIVRLASRILVFRDHRVVGEVADVGNGTRGYADISAAIGRYLQ